MAEPFLVDLQTGLDDLQDSYKGDEDAPDPIDHMQGQYALLDAALDQAKADDVISPLPAGVPVADGSRIRTIRDRLVNLGYLKQGAKNTVLDDALADAVLAFQQDAGLTQDRWAGHETWTALQELVSFEIPSNLPRWFDGLQPRRALVRAAHLRLFTLGMVQSKPGNGEPGHLQSGLQQFVHVAQRLQFGPSDIKAELSFETLTLLFDQDALLQGLAAADAPKDKDMRFQVHAFVMSMAKIELWMLGFHVDPNGHNSAGRMPQRRSRSLDSNLYLATSSVLYKAIREYWILHADKKHAATRAHEFVRGAFPQFFKQLQIDTSVQNNIDSHEVYDYFNNTKNKKRLNGAWKRIKAMGARLWDGLKRIWNWLVNLAEKVIHYTENILRIGYEFIHRAYATVTTAIEVLVSSVNFLVHKELPGSDVRNVIAYHDLDFDFITISDVDATPEKVRHMADILLHNASGFVLASSIISVLADVVKMAIKGAFTGYLMLLVGLLNLYRQVADLVPSLAIWQSRETYLNSAG